MKCLIVDEMHDSIVPMLAAINIEGHYHPEFSRADILHSIPDYQGIIIRSKTVLDVEFIERAKNIKFIARAGAGLDKLDVPSIEKAGIGIMNAPEGNRNAVAEHVLGMVLAMSNSLHKGDREIRSGIWNREGNRGWELSGKTVGLFGYGYMGMATAKKLKALGCRVLAYDKYKKSYSDEYVDEVSMSTLFDQCDIFSIHVPLTEETNGLVNSDFLTAFRKPIHIVNTARGEILVLNDLLDLIDTGKISGAALDVLENEKLSQLSDNQQLTFENVLKSKKIILSPHVAGWTVESYKRINEVLVAKIQKYFDANPT